MKFMSRSMVALAAASMAFAPIAAQANTRAGDSGTVYSEAPASQPGLDRETEGENLRGTRGIIAILLLFGAAAGLVFIIDDDNDQSPGT